MRLPWQTRTGLEKAAAILASIFTISLGLCGANVILFDWCGGYEHPEAPKGPAWLLTPLIVTGIAESIFMLVAGAGLVVVTLLVLARWIHRRFFPNLK